MGEMCVKERVCVCVRVSRKESSARLYKPSCTEEWGLGSMRENKKARKKEAKREKERERERER